MLLGASVASIHIHERALGGVRVLLEGWEPFVTTEALQCVMIQWLVAPR